MEKYVIKKNLLILARVDFFLNKNKMAEETERKSSNPAMSTRRGRRAAGLQKGG